MRLPGWNDIPRGYGADFDTSRAPLWLRVWHRVPIVDRFSYPVLVSRGYGYLTPISGFPEASREPVRGGWRVRPDDHRSPTATVDLS